MTRKDIVHNLLTRTLMYVRAGGSIQQKVDALEAIYAAAKVLKEGWISVEDRLPEKDVEVLWYTSCGQKDINFIDPDETFQEMQDEGARYTHWMPLPPGP